MEWADFVHLVRTSEQDSAENSSAYRRSVAAFAALGYAWVLGCLALGAGLLGWAGLQLLQGRFRLGLVLLGVVLLLNALIAALRYWSEQAEGGSLSVATVGGVA